MSDKPVAPVIERATNFVAQKTAADEAAGIANQAAQEAAQKKSAAESEAEKARDAQEALLASLGFDPRENESLRAENDGLKEAAANLRQELAATKDDLTTALKKAEETEKALGKANTHIEELKGKPERNPADVNEIKRLAQELETAKANAKITGGKLMAWFETEEGKGWASSPEGQSWIRIRVLGKKK